MGRFRLNIPLFQQKSAWRMLSIRVQLTCLVAVCVVPVWVAAALLVNLGYQAKRALVTQGMQEMSRSLSMVVDRELASVQAALTALATSPSFASGDLAAVHAQAATLLQSWPGANIVVCDARGQQLINLRRPFGAPLPQRAIPETVRRIFEDGTPVVSDLYRGAVSRQPLIAIDVPVFRQGRVVYDLSMALPSSRLDSILSRRQLSGEMFGAILDSGGMVVAKTRQPQCFVGHRWCSVLRNAVTRSATGMVRTVSLEGDPLFTTFSRTSLANWVVVIGVPGSTVTGELHRWLAWALAGALFLSIAGVALAMVIGRNVTRSIRSLLRPALALGRGESLESMPCSGLREVDDVAQSLMRMSDLARERLAARDRAQELLHQSEQRYRSVVEDQTELICRFAPDGTLSFVNPVYCRVFGGTWDELVGKTWQTIVFDDDIPIIEERLAALSPANPVVIVENQVHTASGEVRWMQFVNRGIFDAQGRLLETQSVGRDITPRKRAEADLRENQQLLQAVVNGAEEIIFVKDLDGRFILVNPALLQLLGKPAREVLGRHSGQLYSVQDDADAIMENSRRVMATGRAETLEESVPTRSGYRLLSITKIPRFDADGRVIGVIGVGHDITERKLIEAAQKATIELLRLCNLSAGVEELVFSLDRFFREMTGCGSVTLRLLGDDDFSGYEGGGCRHYSAVAGDVADAGDPHDRPLCHGAAGWMFACLCGRVLAGSSDSDSQLFTARGSFWTNCARELSRNSVEPGREAVICNRCNLQGYESVALLPMRSCGDILGLLQLGDTRKGCFTVEKITLLERLVDYAAIALSKLMVDEALSRSEQSLREAQELAHLGSFVYSIPEDRCVTSVAADRICGADARYERTRAGWLAFIHPAHRKEMEGYLQDVIQRRLLFDREFRIVRINDGEVRWLHMLGRVECGVDGSPLRMVGTLHDITERRQAEDDLRAYARRIMDVEENLRKVVAAELHDEIGRDLTVLGINLSIIGTSLPLETAAPLRTRVEDSGRMLENVSRTVRNIMSTLRPPVLDDYGLAAALRWYGELFSRRTGIDVRVQVDDELPRVAAEREIALFRIAQEALTNVAKHAAARNVTLWLAHDDGLLLFSVVDDGRGLACGPESRNPESSGWGMTIMRERAELFGGVFRVHALPAGGVGVTVEMPKEEP